MGFLWRVLEQLELTEDDEEWSEADDPGDGECVWEYNEDILLLFIPAKLLLDELFCMLVVPFGMSKNGLGTLEIKGDRPVWIGNY